jgi:phosphohistidine phosphatase SixA
VIRARETADLFAAEIGGASVELAPFLACGMEPGRALRELKAWEKLASVMIIGHEPDFGLLVTQLLGVGDNGRIRVRKASLIALEVTALRPGGARLEFSIPARLMS